MISKKIFLLIFAIFILLFSSCNNSTCKNTSLPHNILSNEKYYLKEYKDGKYYYEIFNMNGDILDSGYVERVEPKITFYSDNIIGIVIQMGTGPSTRYGYFYDIENSVRSPKYEYILDYSNGFVAYGDFDKNIIVESVFTESNKTLIEYSTFNEPAENIPDFIIAAKFSNDNKDITVEYLSSEEELTSQKFAITTENQPVFEFSLSEFEWEIENFPSNKNVGPIEDYNTAIERAKELWIEKFSIINGQPFNPIPINEFAVAYDEVNEYWLINGSLPDDVDGAVPHALIHKDGQVLAIWMG